MFAPDWRPTDIYRRLKISRGAAETYYHMYQKGEPHCCDVALRGKAISVAMQVTLRTVWNRIRELTRAGLVEHSRKDWNGPNTYTFIARPELLDGLHENYRGRLLDLSQNPTTDDLQQAKPQTIPTPIRVTPSADPAIVTELTTACAISHLSDTFSIAVRCPSWQNGSTSSGITWACPGEVSPPRPAPAIQNYTSCSSGPVKCVSPKQPTVLNPPKPPKPPVPPRYSNPLPESDPYRDAVARISQCRFFAKADLVCWQEASRSMDRLRVPPEWGDEIADYILDNMAEGYHHRAIATAYAAVSERRRRAAPPEALDEQLDRQRKILELESDYHRYRQQQLDAYIDSLSPSDRHDLKREAQAQLEKQGVRLNYIPREGKEARIHDTMRNLAGRTAPGLMTLEEFESAWPERKAPDRETGTTLQQKEKVK